MEAEDVNDDYQVTDALRVQMQIQRQLHEQLVVPRHLQLRVDAQGKYVQSMIENACKVLSQQVAASAGFQAAHEECSELAIKISSGECSELVLPDTIKVMFLADLTPVQGSTGTSMVAEWMSDNSIDSSLTTTGSPISPLGRGLDTGSLASLMMKKRPRPLFGNEEVLLADCSMQPH